MLGNFKPLEFAKKLVSGASEYRVSAFVLLVTGLNLNVAVLILASAALGGKSVAAELAILVGGLCTLSGVSYVQGKSRSGSAGPDPAGNPVVDPEAK